MQNQSVFFLLSNKKQKTQKKNEPDQKKIMKIKSFIIK